MIHTHTCTERETERGGGEGGGWGFLFTTARTSCSVRDLFNNTKSASPGLFVSAVDFTLYD
jgi:hypothetical protein